jgi:transposase-like protein
VFKRQIAKQYRDGDQSLAQVAQQNGLTRDQVKDWVKIFSSELAEDQIIIPMTEQEQKDFELLKKQNGALKEKLEYEQMRNFALETMVDLAKSELGIDLRKNSGAKQPKE